MATVALNQGSGTAKRILPHFDWWLLFSAAFLIFAGLASQFSLDHARNDGYFAKQLLRVSIGIAPLLVLYLVNPQVWKKHAITLYLLNLALLVLVLVMGKTGGGAQRWLEIGPFDFQPSEMGKLSVVVTLASLYMARFKDIRKFKSYMLAFVHVLVPMGLIFLQPHLGAALAILVIWLTVSFISGVRIVYILGTLALAGGLFAFALKSQGILKPYQKERVRAMLNADESGNSYQTMRAEVALGSGGLMGTGFLHGAQKKGEFIPKQHTDFVFTVIGEELGLLGSTLLLSGFAFFLYRVWKVMSTARDPYHRMLAAGLFAVFGFHTVVNLGSVLHLLPVVGLWLPFMSYGGTLIWLCMSSLGLLLNISQRERASMF